MGCCELKTKRYSRDPKFSRTQGHSYHSGWNQWESKGKKEEDSSKIPELVQDLKYSKEIYSERQDLLKQ